MTDEQTTEAMEPNPQLGSIPLGPVPTGFSTQLAEATDGRKVVVMTMHTPLGQLSFFMDPASTSMLRDALTVRVEEASVPVAPKLAVPAKPGLIVPGGGRK